MRSTDHVLKLHSVLTVKHQNEDEGLCSEIYTFFLIIKDTVHTGYDLREIGQIEEYSAKYPNPLL